MKEIAMEKVLRCADVSGTSCQFVARGQTMEEILEQPAATRWKDTGSPSPRSWSRRSRRGSPRRDRRDGGRRSRPPAVTRPGDRGPGGGLGRARAKHPRALRGALALDGDPLRRAGPAADLPARPGLRPARHRLHARGHGHRAARGAPVRRLDRRRLRPPRAARALARAARPGLRAARRPVGLGGAGQPGAHRRRVQPGHHRVLHALDRGGAARAAQRGAGLRGAGAHAGCRSRAADPGGSLPGRHGGRHAGRPSGRHRPRRRRGGGARRRLLRGDVQPVPAAGPRASVRGARRTSSERA